MILKLFRFVVPLALILAIWLLPDVTLAQSKFVTCDGTNCSACNLADMANIIIKWLFGIVFMIFAVLMVIAGFGLVTSGGNTTALQEAKSKFTNAMIGLLIMMSAWLVVDTIMKGVVGGGETGAAIGEIAGWGPWSEVKCMTQTKTVKPSPDSTAAVTGTYGFQAYSHDEKNNCKVGHSASLPTLTACESALASVPEPKYVTKTCDDKPVDVAIPHWDAKPLCKATGDPTADGKFSYQAGMEAQAVHYCSPYSLYMCTSI